jgi:hypothetical protein
LKYVRYTLISATNSENIVKLFNRLPTMNTIEMDIKVNELGASSMPSTYVMRDGSGTELEDTIIISVCCSLDLGYLLKAHVLKSWSQRWCY